MIFKVGGVIVYLGILVWLGVLASRRMKDIKDYFAAGKNLGFLAVAFSARATGESAWLLLGLTGMGCALGVKAFWVVVGEVIGVAQCVNKLRNDDARVYGGKHPVAAAESGKTADAWLERRPSSEADRSSTPTSRRRGA